MGKRQSVKHPHIRVRTVDFQNLLSDSDARLTEFEKEVKKQLRTKSFRDEWIEEESKVEDKRQAIQAVRRLRRFVKYAELTPKQKECYKRFFLTKRKNVTLRKIAEKLGISLSSAWSRVHGIIRKLRRVQRRQEEGKKLKEAFDNYIRAGKLRRVFRLYFIKGWPPRRIAQSLHSSLSAIYDNILTIRILSVMYYADDYIGFKEARDLIPAASVEKSSNKTP